MTTIVFVLISIVIVSCYHMPLGRPDHGFRIHYRSGYKYQLARDYHAPTGIFPEFPIATDWIDLDPNGWILIRKGYAWDGPSGPTLDTSEFMRAALVHDALYQLIRMGTLPQSYRIAADSEMRRICKEDRMNPIRRFVTHAGVSNFAAYAADPKHVRKEYSSPT